LGENNYLGALIIGVALGFICAAGLECFREKFFPNELDRKTKTHSDGSEWGLIIPAIILCAFFLISLFSGKAYTLLGISGFATVVLLNLKNK